MRGKKEGMTVAEMSVTQGGPEPNEIGSLLAPESEELNSWFLFLTQFLFLFFCLPLLFQFLFPFSTFTVPFTCISVTFFNQYHSPNLGCD